MPKKGEEVSTADTHSLMIKTISEVVTLLVQAYDRGEKINLTRLKTQISGQNKLSKMPKIVDILSACLNLTKINLCQS